MMRPLLLLATAALIAAAGPTASHHSAAETGRALAAALAAPARADQQGDDQRRHAAEVLAFSGVGPGDRVIDFFPGQGYWTRLFSAAVGSGGHVLALWPHAAARYTERTLPALQARNLANVEARLLEADTLPADASADLVWTVQNYHDVNNMGGAAAIAAFNRSVFAALKPGGRYVIVDHADAPGTGLTGTDTRHRIDPAIVRRQVEAAGFRFAGESRALRNPADTHQLNVFDPAVRGHTDQFIYRFTKPMR